MSVRVLVVDDHLVFSELLADAIRRSGYEAEIVDPARHSDEQLLAAAAAEDVAVVVLDLTLGPGRRGLPLIGPLIASDCEVIVLTADDAEAVHEASRRAGAVAALTKREPLERVLAEIEAVAPEPALDAAGDPSGLRLLTRREQEVLSGLLAGHSAKEIAAALGIALPTVRTQLRTLYRKLKVDNARAAIVIALRSGWSVDA